MVNDELRLLDTFASKIAKICNFWKFRHVIQLIKQLFTILKGQNVLRSQIFAIFEA